MTSRESVEQAQRIGRWMSREGIPFGGGSLASELGREPTREEYDAAYAACVAEGGSDSPFSVLVYVDRHGRPMARVTGCDRMPERVSLRELAARLAVMAGAGGAS